jgi:NAD(P)-dependent dehydrogenase (short-subunit alcohol dehydrogenase family)
VSDWLGLAGQRVVVAGGAGTFGAALVDGFRAAGSVVVAIDVQPGDHVQADLRDPRAARAAIDEAAERLGGLDVFVHSVGINRRKPIEEYEDDDWDDIVSINLSSAFYTAQAALPRMRAQRHGRIVFFSSVAGRSGHKNHGPYAATKGAINQLMRVMAHEHAADGVTVNAVAPGYVDTAFTADLNMNGNIADHVPARRAGTPEEVAACVRFLAGEQASYVTGTTLTVDGGMSA